MKRSLSIFFISLLALGPCAWADYEMPLLRRVAVFPISDAGVSTAEDAWWQMRELLTKDQMYLVAAKRFMVNRGVYQARTALKPADAIILGKILDASTLITSYVKDRKLTISVYEAETGLLIWQDSRDFDAAMPINDQLMKVSGDLMNKFIVSVPYQGFQILDEMIGKPVYERDTKKFAMVYVGTNSHLTVGDQAQWVKVFGDPSGPILNSAPKMQIIAEGVITKIAGDRAEVEVQKVTDLTQVKESSLIRFPKELSRLKDLYAKGEHGSELTPEYLTSEMKSVDRLQHQTSQTTTTVAFIVSIAGFLLLAF